MDEIDKVDENDKVDEAGNVSDEDIRHAWRYFGRAVPEPLDGEGRIRHACSQPIELANDITGEKITVRCKTRSRKQCPGCSWLYWKDTAMMLRDGMAMEGNRFFFLTLTAPSFGATHRLGSSPTRRCACGRMHDRERDADLLGVPVDMDTYDYGGQVFFNYHIGAIWDATRSSLRRIMPGMVYAKIFEWQKRGALHVHVLIRISEDAYTRMKEYMEVKANRPLTSKEVAGLVGVRAGATITKVDGVTLSWGEQVKCEEVIGRHGADRTVAYLRKAVSYVCKDVVDNGPKTLPSNRRHMLLLDWAAHDTCCDRCRRRLAELVKKTKGLCDGDRDGQFGFIQRFMRAETPCRALAHRRWGARSGVMSMSRTTTRRVGWSVEGLTRKILTERRHDWWRQINEGDPMRRVKSMLQEYGLQEDDAAVNPVPE